MGFAGLSSRRGMRALHPLAGLSTGAFLFDGTLVGTHPLLGSGRRHTGNSSAPFSNFSKPLAGLSAR